MFSDGMMFIWKEVQTFTYRVGCSCEISEGQAIIRNGECTFAGLILCSGSSTATDHVLQEGLHGNGFAVHVIILV